MKKISTLTLILLITCGILAQVPQKMSYQAVIRDALNNLVSDHIVGMRISILQGSASGIAVYSETQTPVTNYNGLVSIEIGGGAGFAAIDWESGPYFLKTETDPLGGTSYTIVGTSQLLSVPYAMHAKTAENGFSGNYNDLINKPVLFNGTWASLTGKPSFATVATSGSYNDLSNTPNLSGYLTSESDPVFLASPSHGITSGNITNWNTAYGWGNHASAGYAIYPTQTGNSGKYLRTNGTIPSWATITPTITNIQSSFQFVTYKPGSSTPIAFGTITSSGSISSGSGNFTCSWNASSQWYEITITAESYYFPSYTTIVQMTDGSPFSIPFIDSVSGKLLVIIQEQSF
jgi:hypothetical protein